MLICYIGSVFKATGFFRNITPTTDVEIIKKIDLKGAEDFAIARSDSFMLISATSREVYPPKEKEMGGIYYLDLKSKTLTPKLISGSFEGDFAPHGISMIKIDSSFVVMAINHTLTEHSIEVFNFDGKILSHVKTLKHSSMIHPNDLVLVDENKFYFANDHGFVKGIKKLAEEYLGLAVSNVVYYNGKNYEVVAEGIAYANGINYDKERKLIYVASPRKFLVKVYQRNDDGSLTFIENIKCGTGVDNIELDNDGDLWIGAHPNLLGFKSYAKGKKKYAPSEVIKVKYNGRKDYNIEKLSLIHI